jgi:hypothetical protein
MTEKQVFDRGRRRLLKTLGVASACMTWPAAARTAERVAELSPTRTKLRPALDGDWWLIGPSPNLDGLLPAGKVPNAIPGMDSERARQFLDRVLEVGMSEAWVSNFEQVFSKYAENRNEPVDHHLFQDSRGTWHLWGCVRQTSVGRILYHWEADTLTQSPWKATSEIIRCDQGVGECMNTTHGEEVIQSPYFVYDDGLYYMFYGGASTGLDSEGKPVEVQGEGFAISDADSQICLTTSTDGRNWTRHRDANGNSRVLAGPAAVRDPCLIKIGDLWHLYYAAFEGDLFTGGGCFARTSKDLINWSDYKLVHRDAEHGGPMTFTHECPHVVYRGGFFYLFRTENYYDAVTHVYRSEDPMDFGVDTAEKFVTTIACAAPEIYTVDGQEYVSSNHDPKVGTKMCRLKWVKDRTAS